VTSSFTFGRFQILRKRGMSELFRSPFGRTAAIRLLTVIGLVCAGAASVLILDATRNVDADRSAAHQFQRMAGGLGLGATVCPRWCFVNFDVRLEPCTCTERPLPGGYCYCPEHNSTVTSFDLEEPDSEANSL